MKQKPKTYIRPIVIVMIFAFLTIGYAYLTSALNINGTTLLKKPTWDVHFENVQVKDGSVTGDQVIDDPEIDTDRTTVSFHVNLKKPGDFYEFTVDAVNAGTIDAMINTYTEFDLTEDQLKYLETSVTYEDGEEIAEKQQLLAGDFAIYKIVVSFKKDLSADDLPSTPEQLDLEFTVEYVQKDDTAITRLAETNSLYNVLKREYDNNGLAKLYTGAHQDSMNAIVSNKNIYHWYADNDTDGITITDMNNVIFANHCWQMIRTTDTGGVRLIYNGEAVDNKCLNTRGIHVGYSSRTLETLTSSYWYGTDYTYDSTNNVFSVAGTTEQAVWSETTGPGLIGKYTCKLSNIDGSCSILYLIESYYNPTMAYVMVLNNNSHYSQFGKLPYNASYLSPSDEGYMYNIRYPYNEKEPLKETMLSSSSLRTNYWYANNILWGSPTSNKYNLVNAYQVSSTDDYTSLVGKYTLEGSTQAYAYTYAYYIAAVNGSTYYYIPLGNESESTHDLSFYNYVYTYGDSYTDNGDGTYTINNPASLERNNWYTNYNSVAIGNYVCKNAVNNTCSELWYITKTTNTYMEYIKVSDIKYAKGFTYDNNTGTYTLNGESVSFWNITDSTNKTSLNNAHYTCWNKTGKCSTISYIYYVCDNTPYYIDITEGKNVETALNEMLYNDNVNTTNSIIKSGVDAWFKQSLLNYSNYLEDTIFCDDRSQKNPLIHGWNPNGGSISTYMNLSGSSDLSCPNETDRFSVGNEKAKLVYKVGLMSQREMNLANNDNIQKTGETYWLGSAGDMTYLQASAYYVRNTGYINRHYVTAAFGVRPAISLKPGIIYSSGDGSMANPYVIDTD